MLLVLLALLPTAAAAAPAATVAGGFSSQLMGFFTSYFLVSESDRLYVWKIDCDAVPFGTRQGGQFVLVIG